MFLRRFSALVAAASLTAAAIACNTPGGLAPTPTPGVSLPTSLPGGILSPTPPAATSGPAAPTAAQPTAIPPTQAPAQPPAQSTARPPAQQPAGPAAKRVSFETGATYAGVSGSLAAHGVDRYVLNIGAGQVLEVRTANNNQPTFTVTGPTGAVLGSGALVRTAIPTSGDYTVQVSAGDQPIQYGVQFIIPEPIRFEQNATEAEIKGKVLPGATYYYSINLQAYQFAQALFSNNTDIHTRVYGVDGTVLKTNNSAGATFGLYIPTAQDYVIAVVDGGGHGADYTFRMVVPQKISFAEGATWANAAGTLPAHGRFEYVLYLLANQVMDIASNVPFKPGVAVTAADGSPIAGGGAGSFRGRVPRDDYYVVTLTGGDQQASYDLNITIPARITFASGANSAALTGSLKPHETVHYVIEAGKDQTLDALFTPENTAKMSIYGVDGTVLWSGMGEGTHWTGKLPSSQDYFIVFSAGDKAVDYTLKVTVS